MENIGKVHNHTTEDNLKMPHLWRQAISGIEITGAEDEIFTDKYSHYMVIHDPLKTKFHKNIEELNKRFCNSLGVSVVSYIQKEGDMHYVRGLMAENGARIYSILPYTSFDQIKEAKFPQTSMEPRKMEAFNSLLPSLNGKNILDVGCGIGSLAINMAKAKPESIIYGVDIIDGSIEQCKLNAKIEGVTNTHFAVASAYELPFEDEYFDTVTCFFMLHHLDDVAKALQDIKRVLNPSGEVFAVEPIDHFHGVQRGPEDWKALFLEAGYSVEAWEKNNVSYIHAVLK